MAAKVTALAKIPEKAIRQQLTRILASKTFSQVDRLKRFLNFIVDEAVGGRGAELKEYVIGAMVFAKEPSFDPRTDPIVRVQARRLRARLDRYYRDEGHNDEVIIELPKGGYAPVFRRREVSVPVRPPASATLISRNTITVATFADHSPDRGLQYFCRGLRDEIVHGLTALKTLRVLAVRAEEDDPPRPPTAPQPAVMLKGSVRVAGDRLRVTVQLVDGSSGYYVWSESLDVPTADPIAAQETIAHLVVGRIESALPDRDHQRTSRRTSDNLAARNLYLQGRYHLNQRTEDGLQKAVEFFEKALVEDAEFSLAHSGLADAYSLLAHYGVLGPADVWARAASSAASAVMLDSHSAEAHTSLAHVRATQDWDWAGAERAFQRAIQLNPDYPTAHHWYAMSCLVPVGRLDEALEQILLAQSLDPVSSIIARDVAVIYMYRRELDAALDQCDQTIELNPHFAPAYLTLGVIQEQRKDFDESAAAFRRAVDLSPHSPRMQAALARTLALSGKRDTAVATLHTLTELSRTRYVSPVEFVTIHLALGESNKGFTWLTKACDDRCFELLALKVDPRFDAVKADPRFAALIKRARLE